MKRSGRANWLMIVGTAGAVLIITFIVFFNRESPSVVATRFMSALAKGDVDTLTELSYGGDETKGEIRKKWDFTVNKVAPYYKFACRVVRYSQVEGGDQANVVLQVVRNATSTASYEQHYDLPMVKTGEGWKVNYREINREMYPGLPR